MITESELLNRIDQKLLAGNHPFELRSDAFALIFGLGGTGVNYAARVKELFLKRYGKAELDRRVRFLVIDTDQSELDNKPVFTDAEKVRINGFKAGPWIDSWLSEDVKNSNFGNGGNGAAGIRMCGRWQLFSSEPQVSGAIQPILQEFKNRLGQEHVDKIYVLELASICGGTGCGTFIDIPYFVRHSMERLKVEEKHVEFYGFFELPDSKIDSASLDEVDKERCRANSYAALKELQFFMGKTPEYSAEFQGDTAPYKSNSRIFTQCFLLSNWTQDLTANKPYNRNPVSARGKSITYLDGAIPEAINIILSKEREENTGGKKQYFGFNSKMSNIIGQGFRTEGPSPEGSPLIVATFGASKIEIPLSEIILAIFNRLFLELRTHWKRLENTGEIAGIIRKEIVPAFGIHSLYGAITGILDFESAADAELKSPEFFKDMRARIEALEHNAALQKSNGAFIKTLEKTVDRIYEEKGPFAALKALETGEFEPVLEEETASLAALHEAFKKDAAFVRKEVDTYNNFSAGLFGIKQKEKDRLHEKLVDTLNTQQAVFDALKKIVSHRADLAVREIHDKYFTRVTRLIEELTGVLKTVTGVETASSWTQTAETTVFSWDFSGVPYEAVHKRVDSIFAKKITQKSPGSSQARTEYVRGKILRFDGGSTKDELFSLPLQKKGISVKLQDTNAVIDNVVKIEEVLTLNGKETKEVPLADILKKFLLDVKNTPSEDILDLLLDDFADVLTMFTKESFQDLLVMYSSKWDFSQSIITLNEDAKKRLFKEAVERFKIFALPSYPVAANKANLLLNASSFSVTLEPEFDEAYSHLIDEVRDQIIKSNNTERIPRKKIAMMIAVNFYFDYGLSWYLHLEDCRRDYEKLRGAGKTMHLAEGISADWSLFPEIEAA